MIASAATFALGVCTKAVAEGGGQRAETARSEIVAVMIWKAAIVALHATAGKRGSDSDVLGNPCSKSKQPDCRS